MRGSGSGRARDAARLLPVLGAALFLLPDLVLSGEGGVGATAPWLVYLFISWGLLIGLAALVARAQRRDRTDGDGGGP